MKSLFLTLCITAIGSLHALTQNVAINNTGTPADPSAILDISAPGKGILVPRMMPWERAAIQNPANGLLVFDLNSNSFWYYSNGWHELGGNGIISGPAGGDLSGNYPNPNVAKLQNLDVADGVPFDRQVLKWDALANNWKGRNDSLFLPYNVAHGSPTKLFGITNNNTTAGSSAIFGRSGIQSGINPGFTMGVWGDNGTGMGVVGTSNQSHGVFGSSIYNHGVAGFSGNPEFAGVYGSHAETDGIGVMGEVEEAGIAVVGKGTGPMSIAGRFENSHPENTHMALDARNLGNGAAGTFWTSNVGNSSPTVLVSSHSAGHSLFALHDSIGDNNSAVRAWHLGLGEGIYAKSHRGTSGKMIIDNLFNNNSALYASTIGNGNAGVFSKGHLFGENEGGAAVLVDNYSRSVALKVRSLYPSQLTAAVDVEYSGYSYAVDVASANGGIRSVTANPSDVAVFGSNNGEGGTAIQGYVTEMGSTGVHGTANGFFGVGVLGSSSNTLGFGVKGENASDLFAAVTGENTGTGGGVKGVNKSSFGYGVIGDCGTQHGIAGHFRSANSSSEISPAIWALVSSLSNGVEINVTNEANAKNALQVNHDGTGNIALFRNYNGDEIKFANNCNVSTAGTMTVKNNKGIVRNSSSTQLRMETVDVQLIHFNMPVGAMVTEVISFGQTFGSAPVVSVGNIHTGFTGPCDKMTVQVKNVTTSGCTVTMYNPSVSGNPNVSGTWKLLVVGAE